MSEVLSVPQTLRAFQSATGMGVRVCLDDPATPLWASENPFCQLMRLCAHYGAPCQHTQQSVASAQGMPAVVRRCGAGLEHVAVPLPGKAGRVGWIESGQVFLQPPRREDFASFCLRHPGWNDSGALPELEAAFFATPVLSRERLAGSTNLLRLLARELEPLVQHHHLVRSGASEDLIEKAKQYVNRNLNETICLPDIARHIGVSSAHLCRFFKRRTGRTLGDFIADTRVARARQLLAQGRCRVVDAAFAAGFQSVRQFNHVFKARTQLTPSQYARLQRQGT